MGIEMSLLSYAESELDRIGLTEEDEYNRMMRKHILHMIKEFSDEGHSGFSAPYAIQILTKLMSFKPLTPLTGEDDEWCDVSEYSGTTTIKIKDCLPYSKKVKTVKHTTLTARSFGNGIKMKMAML